MFKAKKIQGCDNKTVFKKKKYFTSKLDLNLRKKLHSEFSLYGSKSWTLRKVDQKYLESLEMCCCRRMETSWTDRVRNEELVQRVKEVRNNLQTIKRRKAEGISHIWHINCRLRHVFGRKIEGMAEVTGRGKGGKREQLVDIFKEMIGYKDMKIEIVSTR
jgi:hypothetical protein